MVWGLSTLIWMPIHRARALGSVLCCFPAELYFCAGSQMILDQSCLSFQHHAVSIPLPYIPWYQIFIKKSSVSCIFPGKRSFNYWHTVMTARSIFFLVLKLPRVGVSSAVFGAAEVACTPIVKKNCV